jgi:nucleosome binding factor SPN SPT16 subunit
MDNLIESLASPDDVGSAEYRAIYELLEGAETRDEALAICEEFRSYAEQIAEELRPA